MGSKIVLKNAQDQEFSINHLDNAGAIAINSSDIVTIDINGKINEKDISYKSTPISITSWSYVGTTITLNVASHSFVAGDYIEVSGLTATTYAPNGVQLVASVTATTIVFALGATPTGTAGVSSATVNGYATVNGRVIEGIGVNQTWQDVTASRIKGITYTNSTGKSICIILQYNCGDSSTAIFNINGTLFTNAGINTAASTGMYQVLTYIIPNGATYNFTGVATIGKWQELR